MKEFKFKIDGTEYAAQVEEQGEGKVQVTVNGKAYSVDVEGMAAPRPQVKPVAVGAAAPAPKAAPAGAVSSAKLSAPLPGNITKILVNAGDKVKKGDTVIIMEAMKMENNITAEADCTIKAVKCQVGQSVNQGDVLVELECAAAPVPKPVAAPAPKAAPAPAAVPAAAPAGGKAVVAPLPGTVTEIKVAVGQAVKKGEIVAVMEAMKMQNDIVSEWDGTVSAINANQGASVNVGDALVTIG